MRRRWLWLMGLGLAAACAPARPWRAALGPAVVFPTATARVVVAFVVQTPTAAPPTPTPAATLESTLPAEPAWGGASACPGPAVAPTGRGVFGWPTASRWLSGYDFDPVTHPGLDLAAGLGEPIYAADSGVAVYAGWNDQGYGRLVILDHGNGWHTLYAHLSQLDLHCGQGVMAGDVIGLAGSSGHSTGPHLHFELRQVYGRVNPWRYLP